MRRVFLLYITLAGCGVRPASNAAHRTPGANHAAFTNDCSDCHQSEIPAPVGNVVHGDSGRCGACHLYDPPRYWATKPYAHNPSPTSCVVCHGPRKPPDATHAQVTDCVSCHTTDHWPRQ